MTHVTFFTSYPWCESDSITFPLWPGYGCRDAEDAHGWMLELLTAGDDAVEVLDAEGGLWSFWRGTVAGVATVG